MTVRYAESNSVYSRDSHGDPPLHIASRSGHSNTMQILLERGAEVDEWNYTGNTALWVLIENVAEPNRKDGYGYSELHYGAKWDNIDIVGRLVDSGADVDAEVNH